MYSNTELDRESLIFAAEQFIVFNDENADYLLFIEMKNNKKLHV